MKTPCEIKNMHFDEYLQVKACHKSALSHVKTAKHLRKFESKSEDTDPLRVGRIFHALLLEPDVIDELEIYSQQEWIPKKDHPDGLSINDQKVKWKEDRSLYYANNKEKEGIDVMIEAIKENPISGKYIEAPGSNEVSLFWDDPRTGLKCKTRIDKITDEGVIVEVKTDTDPEPEAFGKKAYQYDYQVGAWFNREGYREVYGKEPKAFIFIAVEKSEPYSVGVYMMNAHDFDSGEIKGVPKMIRYKMIKRGGLQDHNQNDNGEFEVIPLQTPQWEMKLIDDEMGEIDAPMEESEL